MRRISRYWQMHTSIFSCLTVAVVSAPRRDDVTCLCCCFFLNVYVRYTCLFSCFYNSRVRVPTVLYKVALNMEYSMPTVKTITKHQGLLKCAEFMDVSYVCLYSALWMVVITGFRARVSLLQVLQGHARLELEVVVNSLWLYFRVCWILYVNAVLFLC